MSTSKGRRMQAAIEAFRQKQLESMTPLESLVHQLRLSLMSYPTCSTSDWRFRAGLVADYLMDKDDPTGSALARYMTKHPHRRNVWEWIGKHVKELRWGIIGVEVPFPYQVPKPDLVD